MRSSTVRAVRALVLHELRLLASLLRWMFRRPHGVADGRAFGYARGQGAMMIGCGFVCVVETVMMSLLLRGFPTAHAVFLFLDLYTLVVIAGLHAASVTRPHVLTGSTLRLRRFASVDLCVPLAAVTEIRRELRTTHEKREGELALEIGSQTTIALELAEPVDHFTFFGRRRPVRLVRFHADDADQIVGFVREFTRARTRSRAQARTAPSSSPAPPG